MSKQQLDDTLLDEAIEWVAQLQSGHFDQAQQQALQQWLGRSARHAQVFDQLLHGLAGVQASPLRGRISTPLLKALAQPSSRRRFIDNSLAVVGVCLSAALLGRWLHGGMSLPGEWATGTGERRQWQLEDGSRVQLNARSRVLPRMARGRRQLVLSKGLLLLDVNPNVESLFTVLTDAGSIHSAHGQLQVGEEGEAIRLLTLQGNAELRLGNGDTRSVQAGRSLLFDEQGLKSEQNLEPGEGSWASGWLEVNDKPLRWLVDAFRPYLPGVVTLDESVAAIRVNGLFPLDDMSSSLELLQSSLPVRVQRYSDYWLRITA